MREITLTEEVQRKLKKELLTMKWDSPEDATRVRVLLDKYTGMFNYGYDNKPPKSALEIFDKANANRDAMIRR